MESTSFSSSKPAPGRECEQCGWVFSKPSKLRNHLAKTVSHSKDNFPCPVCFKQFRRSANLNHHMKVTHWMTIQEYKSTGGMQLILKRATPKREQSVRSRSVDPATAFVMEQRRIQKKVIAKKTQELVTLHMKYRFGKKTTKLENLVEDLQTAHKLLKVGGCWDGGCGKTSLLSTFTGTSFRRRTFQRFDISTAQMKLDGNQVELTIRDTSGQEDYDRLRPLSYPNSNAVLVCSPLMRQTRWKMC
ncbi:GTP-binding protein RHO1 [Orchesella cincta]|uniref:GTP-binding protein RHO1 n=1 Tax=Orchesella cincta TaxID=48709 RepID=A0A1D2M8I9_ORCCI|nr:GTP-binding protein RHO1 [Orchesella cincta]